MRQDYCVRTRSNRRTIYDSSEAIARLRRGSDDWERANWPKFVVGLDLGTVRDYTALTVTERIIPLVDPEEASEPGFVQPPLQYHVRYAERFALRTPYDKIIDGVRSIVGEERLVGRHALLIDTTGVGLAVSHHFRREGVAHTPLVVTSGEVETLSGNARHVPKKDLVSCLQIALEQRQLRLGSRVPNVQLLTNELTRFRVKKTKAGNDTFEAWRERDHDDLVICVAMTAWYFLRGVRRRSQLIRVRVR